MLNIPGLYEAVVAGTIANVITVLTLGLAAYLLSLLAELRRRRAFVRMLRGTSTLPEISVYFSSLRVKPEGTELLLSLRGGYAGHAIVKIEYDAARMIREQLRINWLGYVYLAVHTILRGGRPNFSIREPIVDPCPLPTEAPGTLSSAGSCNLVLLGGPVYNVFADNLQEETHLPFSFRRSGEHWTVVHHTEYSAEPLKARDSIPPRELGFIQRVTIDKKTGQRVVWCAGTGSGATYGAVKYLCKNWRELARQHRDQDFSICLAFHDITGPRVDTIPEAKPEILFEKKPQGGPLAEYLEWPDPGRPEASA